jgi:hypothetical protein
MRIDINNWMVKVGFCSLLFCACKSPSERFLDAFKTVNASLERSNKAIMEKNDLTVVYFSIVDKAEKNKDLAQKADSLYLTTQQTLALIGRTEATLEQMDSAGGNTEIAEKLLSHTPLGDSIRTAVLNVSLRCHQGLVTATKRSSLDSLLEQSMAVVNAKQWDGQQFVGEPTAAARTTLEFFQMQCTQAAILTLKDINDHL